MSHVCDICGQTFDNMELNSNDKLVLDTTGKWAKETTYRCFECAKQCFLGR